MDVRIYRKSRNTMQSGRGKLNDWVIELEERSNRTPEDLCGWTSCADTTNQVQLTFPNSEDATKYAQDHGWKYQLIKNQERKVSPRNFADNFKYIPIED